MAMGKGKPDKSTTCTGFSEGGESIPNGNHFPVEMCIDIGATNPPSLNAIKQIGG